MRRGEEREEGVQGCRSREEHVRVAQARVVAHWLLAGEGNKSVDAVRRWPRRRDKTRTRPSTSSTSQRRLSVSTTAFAISVSSAASSSRTPSKMGSACDPTSCSRGPDSQGSACIFVADLNLHALHVVRARLSRTTNASEGRPTSPCRRVRRSDDGRGTHALPVPRESLEGQQGCSPVLALLAVEEAFAQFVDRRRRRLRLRRRLQRVVARSERRKHGLARALLSLPRLGVRSRQVRCKSESLETRLRSGRSLAPS